MSSIIALTKKKEDTLSDWNPKELLPNRLKYAAFDAIVHLNLLLKLDEKSDLTL